MAHALASIALLVLSAGCAARDAAPDGAPREAGHLERSVRDGGAREAARDGGPACPASFTPCGGDVVGSWSLVTVCPAGGASLTKPCDHPFASVAGCTGAENTASCTNVYGGTISLGSDGKATVQLSLHAEQSITLSGACVLAVQGGSSAESACLGLATPNGKKLECAFSSGLCRCLFRTEPETETKTDLYQVSGTELVVTPSAGEKLGGAYCVSGDELVLRGPLGWAFWILRRAL